MPSKVFNVEELWGCNVRLEEGRGKGRWSERIDVIFEADNGKLYHYLVDRGLTENQEDEYPDADINGDIECPEVELYQTMLPVTKWRKVRND